MGAGGGGGGGADRGVNKGAGGLEGVAAGGAMGGGGGTAPVKSRAARAGGSGFSAAAAAATFSFPIVCWVAIIFVPRGQPTVCSKEPRVSLRYHGTGSLHDKRADLHKEDVYSTSIVVWNCSIHAVCLAIAASPRAQPFVFLLWFAGTRRFEASEGSFGACESCFASGL